MSDTNNQRPPYPGEEHRGPIGSSHDEGQAASRQDAGAGEAASFSSAGETSSFGPAFSYDAGSDASFQDQTASMDGFGFAGEQTKTQRFAVPNPEAPEDNGSTDGAGQPPVSEDNSHKKGGKQHKPHSAARMLGLGLIGGVVGAGLLTGALLLTGVVGGSSQVTSSSSQQITIDPNAEDTTLANAVAAKALPSVVSINVTSSSSEGVGSGVVLDTSGNILTNYHVIEDADSISVSSQGNSYDATVVGYDESSDLAVIKIDPGTNTLTPIEVGDSSSLSVGDWVMSIGSPFGLEQSVSSGIVSSLYRSTMLQGSTGNTIYTNLIQTDAAINPGNSGGALVDSEGKLVGINSIIESASGSSSGVGFAIPSNYAVEVAQKLINGETVTHAYLGGSFQTVTATNARRNNLSVNQGAYVAEVTEGGPAANAGLEVGDIITAVDDEEITSSDGLVLAIRSHNVGDTVTIKFVRGTEEKSVSVTLSSDEALQQEQSKSLDTSSQGSILEELLNQYGYGSDSYGNGNSYGNGYSNGNQRGSSM